MMHKTSITDKENFDYKRKSILDITHALEASICSQTPSTNIKKCDKYKERNSQEMLNLLKTMDDNINDDCLESSVFDDQHSLILNDKNEKNTAHNNM